MEQSKELLMKHLKLVDDEYTIENLNEALEEKNIESDMLNAWLNSIIEALALCSSSLPLKEKYTPEFEDWRNRFFEYKPKTFEYVSKQKKEYFTLKDLVRKYEKAMITSALMT